MQRLLVRAAVFSVVLIGPSSQAQQAMGPNAKSSTPPAIAGNLPPVLSAPADPAPQPSAAVIVARMLEKNRERLATLERYESERLYRVEYKGTGGDHHAEIHVHAEYTGPNQKRLTVISESGPKFLRDKVLRKLVESEQEATSASNRSQMALSPENYVLEYAGEDTISTPAGSERAWVLRVTPRVNTRFCYRGQVWISQADYAIMRVVGEPAKNPSWWIDKATFDSSYTRRGDVWLPERNVATSHVRIGGQATLTIDYGTYPVVVAEPLTRSSVQVAAAR